MERLRVEEFRLERDLDAVLDMVGRARERGDVGVSLHPGGLQWWLRRLGQPGFAVAVLFAGDAVAGVGLRDDDEVMVEAVDTQSAGRAHLLEWAEARVRRDVRGDAAVPVDGDDAELLRLVDSRGYTPTESYWYELVFDLAGKIEPAELPDGFGMVSLAADLTERYVALHRAAWSRPDRASTYDRRLHDVVTGMPDFRYDMVPIVAAPDGTLAAYCISWWDERSRSVEIEPLGTHPDFRRSGLARAIVREVLRRSRARGAEHVVVWGTNSLPDAKALYESAGMTTRRTLRDYRLPKEGGVRPS